MPPTPKKPKSFDLGARWNK